MRIDLRLDKARRSSLAVGAGFVALDVIRGHKGDKLAAGGTCGNVMAILAWLGWHSVPIARLGEDTPARIVRADLESAGVDTSGVTANASTPTPIVIQWTVVNHAGKHSHRFTTSCPACGQWLPRFRSFARVEATQAIQKINSSPTVFFFDRVCSGINALARWARDVGAIVMFEPSGHNNDMHFREAIELCHILKFSHERLRHVRGFADNPHPSIVIQTLGAEGLRIRWRGKWTHFNSLAAPRFVDSAGAGDWCSAGLLHVVGQDGAKGLKALRKPKIENAIRIGQALSAINCGFEGARGAMSVLTRHSAAKILQKLEGGEGTLPSPVNVSTNSNNNALIYHVCRSSKQPEKSDRLGRTG